MGLGPRGRMRTHPKIVARVASKNPNFTRDYLYPSTELTATTLLFVAGSFVAFMLVLFFLF